MSSPLNIWEFTNSQFGAYKMLECCKDDSLFSALSMMQFKKFIRIVLMREGRTDGGIQVLDEWGKKMQGLSDL